MLLGKVFRDIDFIYDIKYEFIKEGLKEMKSTVYDKYHF